MLDDDELHKATQLLEDGHTVKEVAENLGYSYPNVASELKEKGITTRNKLIKNTPSGNRMATIARAQIEEAGYDPEDELFYDTRVQNGEIVFTISTERVKQER